VHDRELLEDVQPVKRINMYDPFADVRESVFPFASDDLWGKVDFAHVMYCPDCREAKAEWIKASKTSKAAWTP